MKDLWELILGALIWLIIVLFCLMFLAAEIWSLNKFIGLFF